MAGANDIASEGDWRWIGGPWFFLDNELVSGHDDGLRDRVGLIPLERP